MRFPEFLNDNGTIGFVAPSFGCNTEPYRSAFDNALNKFHDMGYKTDLGPNCYEGKGIGISNTPEKCGQELTEYYVSRDNDCLISCGGGELMCETISNVDFDRICLAEPKWYMGFSDNTNMTYLLATLCDTASIYGPCAAAFGMNTWHQSIKDAFGLLTGTCNTVKGYDLWEKESLKTEENPLAPYNVTEKRILKVYAGNENAGKTTMQGRLLGGCMDCLVNLLGTKYDRTRDFVQKYKDDGIIWFLEACDLNVFAIRRAMWQMQESGWFEYVRGFIIGRPLCFGQEMMGLDAYNAVLEVAGKKNVPVIMDADLGHLPPMMPLIVGSLAKVDVEDNDITIRMNLK
jgi:muramoyltetrapeptide carboxypeptidase LdcA involved in peptidoglycan recycling